MRLFSNQNNHVLKVKFSKNQLFLEFNQVIFVRIIPQSSFSYILKLLTFDSRFMKKKIVGVRWYLKYRISLKTAVENVVR